MRIDGVHYFPMHEEATVAMHREALPCNALPCLAMHFIALHCIALRRSGRLAERLRHRPSATPGRAGAMAPGRLAGTLARHGAALASRRPTGVAPMRPVQPCAGAAAVDRP